MMIKKLRWLMYILACLGLFACGAKTNLVANIQESQANEVILTLEEHGIRTEKVQNKESVTVMVSQEDVPRAMELLRAWGLPREINQNLGSVFKKDGLISSPLEEKARYVYALSQELEQTLHKIDGVITARVHVVLPEIDNFGEVNQPGAASVFIKHRRDAALESQIPQIKKLVLNSIPGLSLERISVSAFPSQLLGNQNNGEGDEGTGENAQSTQKNQRSIWFTLCIVLLALLIPVIIFLLLQRNEIASWLDRWSKRRSDQSTHHKDDGDA